MNYTVRNTTALIILTALLLFSAAESFAQAGAGQMPDNEVTRRIKYIQTSMDKNQLGAQLWWYGWISVYSAGTIAQGVLAGNHWYDFQRNRSTMYRRVRNQDFGQDMLIGAGTTLLGVIGLFMDPFTPALAPDMLRQMPDGTPLERLRKLRTAERLLRKCAQREIDGWGWATHLMNLAVNLGAGLITWLAFERPILDGIINFGIGEAISLLNIFTQPRQSIRSLRNYEKQFINKEESAESIYERQWFFSVYPGGIMVGIRF